ncbi:MAG TPA: hypothetical protein VFX49_01240 [Chloroflexota bacterium]|nr:hypothetical protein [Chloroflexota bacterium]
MPFTAVNSRGATYYLHAKPVALTNGRQTQFFYFAPSERRGEATDELPDGHVIREDPRLQREVGDFVEDLTGTAETLSALSPEGAGRPPSAPPPPSSSRSSSNASSAS